MRIVIASDHAGFELKNALAEHLRAEGREVTDLGSYDKSSVDYPDYGKAAAEAVASGQAWRGVLVCSSGIGISIAANRIPGARAALVMNEDMAEFTRLHNDSNLIAFGQKYITADMAKKYLAIFLSTDFEGGRHQRRVNKMC